jgi:hypothetical protein
VWGVNFIWTMPASDRPSSDIGLGKWRNWTMYAVTCSEV